MARISGVTSCGTFLIMRKGGHDPVSKLLELALITFAVAIMNFAPAIPLCTPLIRDPIGRNER